MTAPSPGDAALRAGAGRRVITPAPGTYLAGYADRIRSFRAVRDDLTATALVLDDGTRRVAVVALDLLAIHEEITARIRAAVEARAGVAADHVLIGCSHSHHAPVASVLPTARKSQKRFVEALVPEVVAAVVDAAEALAPATAHVGEAEVGIAINRREVGPDGKVIIGRDPDGPVDRRLAALRLVAEGGRVVATVLNMACHPTILAPRHRLVSAGWPGEMRRMVEADSGAPALFLQGATGDLNPSHDWGKGELEALARLGREAGEAALAACRSLRPVRGAPLAAACRDLDLRLEPAPHPRTGEPMDHRAALRREAHLPLPDRAIDLLLDKLYPWRTGVHPVEGDGWAVPLALQALRVGDVAIAAQGAETFQGVSLAVRGASPAAFTLFAGYANGMIGYLPTAEEHARGGYEVDLAPWLYRLPGRLAPASGTEAAEATAALVRSLYP